MLKATFRVLRKKKLVNGRKRGFEFGVKNRKLDVNQDKSILDVSLRSGL